MRGHRHYAEPAARSALMNLADLAGSFVKSASDSSRGTGDGEPRHAVDGEPDSEPQGAEDGPTSVDSTAEVELIDLEPPDQ